MNDRIRAQRVAASLAEPVEEAANLARALGLSPYSVNYWIVDNDEMNQLIAYDGFQVRYPHWRWGMKYDRQRKQNQYVGGKAFELVNNDDPSNAFLQESNDVSDQKAVITHVEAHADFFANNRWFKLFGEQVNAAAMLDGHARTIANYMEDPEIGRDRVERWIDDVLCLVDNIDQHRAFTRTLSEPDDEEEIASLAETLDALDITEEVKREVFDREWLDRQDVTPPASFPPEPEPDVLAFLRDHGKQYDEETGKAVEMEPWQRDVVELLREEAYYFAPQKMTKVMNEGWAAYWEAIMMGDEGFAGPNEFIQYADHQSRVLASPGLNPYKLGKELWEYVENSKNRQEVVSQLLRVDGITWQNFHEVVDFDDVLAALSPPDSLATITPDTLDDVETLDPTLVDHEAIDRARAGEIDVEEYPWKLLTYRGMARRHYSLVKPQYRGFVRSISPSELERIGRYLFDDDRYESAAEALSAVDFAAGWDRMREIRESHNDVTFLDEFLTQEFVDENNYFAYEFSHATGDYRVSSTDYEDVKKKLLLHFTNFGKPTITVVDGNYENRNELLLAHRYNGIMLDVEQAKQTLKRVFELWGRPVNLKTIVSVVDENDREVARRRRREPEVTEQGLLIRFDGESIEMEELSRDEVADIVATDVDYDTKPDDWLA